MDDIINQAIESATAEVESAAPTEQPIENAASDETPSEPQEPEDIPFPKKAINALSRRDKQIGKLQAQLAAERLKNQSSQGSAKPNVLREEDFQGTYGEFLKAQARQEFEAELASKTEKDNQTLAQQQEAEYFQARESVVSEEAKVLLESNPTYRQLVIENADIVEAMPIPIQRAFLDADNPIAAFCALAKEGKLESLSAMTPARAAMEIARAEVRGAALIKTKSISNAPTPISSSKGTGGTGKSLEKMSAKELLAHVNKK